MQTGTHGVLELSEQQLRRRNSANWVMYGPGVIPASIAEMDFALDAVVTGLQAARDHLGARLHAEMPSARVILPESAFRHFLARGIALSDGEMLDPSCASFARPNFATSLPMLDRLTDHMVDT
jgi:bifunctional pyridoxal-dependent enzyme with beta-cystathionase and maltose regulon repressor activities